ncbi:MAG: alpha/beta hydrolase, partial [Pirellulales bacterium]|nr:alpha/beta hydrolase [Pirellulales bacterium]
MFLTLPRRVIQIGAFLPVLVFGIALARSCQSEERLQEQVLWPENHAANRTVEPKFVDDPAWALDTAKPPTITPFLPALEKRGGAAIVICPGGGYDGLAMEKEGRAAADWLRQRGVAGIVLRYRCGGENQQPVPLQDAQRAIRTVRHHAQRWGVDPRRVGILGFSAGGHLASSAATMFDAGDAKAADQIARQSSRPDFAVLVYPVISMTPGITHDRSRKNLLGENPSEELTRQWSTDARVGDQTPPTFLVHASDDKGVRVKNSLLFYEALIAHGVPAELHLYEAGGHGFGLFLGKRPADAWPNALESWLRARA